MDLPLLAHQVPGWAEGLEGAPDGRDRVRRCRLHPRCHLRGQVVEERQLRAMRNDAEVQGIAPADELIQLRHVLK